MLSLTTNANGNLTVDNGKNSDDLVDVLKNANATFEIMDIKLAGKIDIKAISDAEKASSSLSESEQNTKLAEAFKEHASFVAINTTDNAVIAKVEFFADYDPEGDCIWNWDGQTSTEICSPSYYLSPRLVFKDGSSIEYETFGDTGFSKLIEDLEEFSAEFE